ncbi:MAG: hypothetical protein ACE15E_21165, partial [Acidobacteriota bacterium]
TGLSPRCCHTPNKKLRGYPGMNAILDTGPDYVVTVLSNYDPPAAETAARQALDAKTGSRELHRT